MDDKTKIRNKIFEIEEALIQQKIFLDGSGNPKFITNLELENKTDLSDTQVCTAIGQLDTKEFIIFNNDMMLDPNSKIKFFVRSRIYHTIWVLYKSTNRTQSKPPEFNISDFQYLRHIKRKPKLTINLHEIFQDPDVADIFKTSKPLLTKILDHVIKVTDKKKISTFQLNSAISLIKELGQGQRSNSQINSKGLVIEAGTGFGKTFAYQLPLLLWIINKKFNLIIKYRNGEITLKDLHVNCSALLVFPRKALAQDQFDDTNDLIGKINDFIKTRPDAIEKTFLIINDLVPDFDSKISSKLKEHYSAEPDIIITNIESLERRLLNPDCAVIYKNSIDCILYDEVHLWDGIRGAEVASINARLQNMFQETSQKSPVFVGMSATIDKSTLHCQKLFALMKQTKPKQIIQIGDTEPATIEHHLILKVRSGRSPLGAAIDTTSCLIHNRRDGLAQWHDDQHRNLSNIDQKAKPKSITFIDSLNQTGKFANKLNDFEYFYEGHGQHARNADSKRPHRRYLFHYQPEQRPPKGTQQKNFTPSKNCDDCVDGLMPELLSCPSYARGECWYYSEDSCGQFLSPPYSNWIEKVRSDRLAIPPDGIRSNQKTSLSDKKIKEKYDYFKYNSDGGNISLFDGKNPQQVPFYSDIDNVVATSTLEVGVDFKNIKEIIQYGQIRSPSSYKQKAGRGAREGNIEDGLFAMTVIDDSPLSYHHFKHFNRLVLSSLDPLKLEPTNPDVLKSNCYLSILDLLALNNINLFQIEKLKQAEIKNEFLKVKNLLSDPSLEKYLERFFDIFNLSNSAQYVKNVITDTQEFFDVLSTEYEFEIGQQKEKKSLHEWLINAISDLDSLQVVQKGTGANTLQERGQITSDIWENITELKEAYNAEFSNNDINSMLDDLEAENLG